MRFKRILLIVVVVLVLVLVLPTYGYVTRAKADLGVVIEVSASKSSATDSSPQYDIDCSYVGVSSYTEYVGGWWGNVFGPAEVEIEYPRVGVEVNVHQVEEDVPTEGRFRMSYSYGN